MASVDEAQGFLHEHFVSSPSCASSTGFVLRQAQDALSPPLSAIISVFSSPPPPHGTFHLSVSQVGKRYSGNPHHCDSG